MNTESIDAHQAGGRSALQALIGTTIAQRYQLESILGTSAMGVVFAARVIAGSDAGMPVAVKIVLPDPRQPHAMLRFLHGARLVEQVQHAHLVRILAHGHLGSEGQAGCYVVMELIDGIRFDRLVQARLDSGAICTLMCQVLSALAHLHAHGIVHRDIKPSNLLVTRAPGGQLACKVGDFGIAGELLTTVDAQPLGEPGSIIGTLAYMAPEQISGRGPIMPAADLYPVGTMLYELLAGALPFSGERESVLIDKITRDPPPLVPHSSAAQELPPPQSLIDVTMRLLARRPEDRYPSAVDAIAALEPLCSPAVLSEARWQALQSPHAAESASQATGTLAAAGAVPEPIDVSAEADDNSATDDARQTLNDAAAIPFIGREDITRVLSLLVRDVAKGAGRVALLTGPTGIGKTAFMDRFVTSLAERGKFLVLRITLHADIDLRVSLRRAIETVLRTAGMGLQDVERTVARFVSEHGGHDAQEAADLVAFLRPDAGNAIRQEQGLALVQRCLQRFGSRRPVLLAVDDLHLVGPDAAAFLELLLFQCGFDPFPLLVVAAVDVEAASEAFRRILARTDRFEGTARFTLPLLPLDQGILAATLHEHLALPHMMARLVAERSAGNPLFALYLAQAALAVYTGPEGDEARPGGLDELPGALHGVLNEIVGMRLARGHDPLRCRSLLETIAVLGTVVEVSLLQEFLGGQVITDVLDRDLDMCTALGLLRPVSTGKEQAVALHPAILRGVLLERLEPASAAALHRRAIAVRRLRAGNDLASEAGALGDHHEALGLRDQAVDWWLRGLAFERQGGSALRGLEWGLKAIAVLRPDDPRHAPCAMALGRTMLDAGDLEGAERMLWPVVNNATPDIALQAGDLLGDVYENQGNMEAWGRLIRELETRLPQAGPDGQCAFYLARTLWLRYRGDVNGCIRDGLRALSGADSGEQLQRAAQRMVLLLLPCGQLDRADKLARLALRESGERLDLRARSLRMLGHVAMWRGESDQAVDCHRQVLEQCRRAGLIARVPIALMDLGDAWRARMEIDEAWVQYRAAERAARELGLQSTIELVRIRLLICDLWRGRTSAMAERIRAASPKEPRATTLAIAWRMYRLLEAWMHAIHGDVDKAIAACRSIDDFLFLTIEMQLAAIIEAVAGHIIRASAARPLQPEQTAIVRNMLEFALTFSEVYPALGSSQRCEELLASLPPDAPH